MNRRFYTTDCTYTLTNQGTIELGCKIWMKAKVKGLFTP